MTALAIRHRFGYKPNESNLALKGRRPVMPAGRGEFVEEPRTLRLARAFAGISDDDLRLCIVELIERIAAQQT